MVLDEAQQVKNPGAAQTRAAACLRAAGRVALTGTPVENRLSELWSIMHVLNPGLLGPAREFRERFALPIERDRDPEATERLRRAHRAVRPAPSEDRPVDHRRPSRQDRDERDRCP